VKRVVSLLCLAALCLFMGFSAMAQSENGTLIGTVLDSDGKAVVGASVTVVDSATNSQIATTKTADEGKFSVSNLPPGHYKVTVTMANFKTSVSNDVEILLHRTYELPVKLEVGAAGVTVNIEAGQQLLETVNTSTQATISGRSITNLPLNSRSALLLAVLDPGAQTVGGPRNSTFEGLPKGVINITFDGINAQDNLLKSNDGFFAINDPRIDDIEEFGITTTGNDPSKTGQGAVQMSYVSKRGGNAFHGGVWEYNRNQAYNSNYYFSNAQGLPRTKDQLNDFGYKIGGPVFKDKLFFFTDFDFFQFPQSVTRSKTIYTPLTASGVFNYIPSVGALAVPTTGTSATTCTALDGSNKTTAASLCSTNVYQNASLNGFTTATYTAINPYVSQVLGHVMAAATAPGVTVSSALVSPYQESIGYNAATIGTRRYPDVRFDYNLTKHHSLEFDYHYAHYASTPDVLNNADSTYPIAPFNTSSGAQISNRNLFVIAERWTIGSNMSNELRMGIQSSPVNFGNGVNSGFWPTTATNFNTAGGLPYTFGLSGVSTIFLGLGGTQGRNSALGELHETFGWTRGSHQISLGGDATLIYYNDFFQVNASAGFGLATNDPLATGSVFAATNPTGATNFPGISSTQLGNVEGLYTSLIGDVTGFSSTAPFNPSTRLYGAGSAANPEKDKEGQLEFGIYAADSWRVRPNVTFNYGLRWEYSGPPWDKFNEYYMAQNANDIFGVSGVGNLFHPGTTAGNPNTQLVNDAGRSWYNRYLKAFAPSVGVAWQPNTDNAMLHHLLGAPGKTVLRAGFSIAYSREGLESFFSIAQSNPGFAGAQSVSAGPANNGTTGQFQAGTAFLTSTGAILQGGTTPLSTLIQNPSSVQNTFALSGAAGSALNVFDPNLRPPMVESWNAGVQRELTSNLALEIRYQANHGVGLTDQYNLNEVNVFENGFLGEFNNANSNLALCPAGSTGACLAAEKFDGIVAATATAAVADFANLFAATTNNCLNTTPTPASCAGFTTAAIAGLAGDKNLPILTAALNSWGTPITPAQLATAQGAPSSSAGQFNSFFRNSTLLTDLGLGGVGSMANSLGVGSTNFNPGGFQNNLVLAGFPSNYFIVNPQATGGAFYTTNAAQSTYNALIVDLRHRPSHGLQFDISYAFSKSLTNYQANSSANFFGFTTLRNVGYDKGPAPFNAAQNVKIQVVYALPFGAGHRLSSSSGFVNRIIGGWEVDTVTRFQTGQPVLVTSGVSGGATFNSAGAGINLVGLTRQQIQSMLTTNKTAVAGAVTYVPVSLLSSASASATANQSVFQPCNVAGSLCSKPFFTGPSFFRADISIVKTTKITERVNFEMRMEALNAFNDADFYWAGGPGTSPQSVSSQSTRFGLMGSNNTNGAYSDINTTQDPGGRVIQLVGRINF
jgi:Carboxypeptidase regulatory-like domain